MHNENANHLASNFLRWFRMSGTKGHSGRRPRLEEYDIERLVASSIRTVSLALDDKSPLSLDRKAELASRIVAKRIPQQLQVEIKNQLSYDQRMSLADKLHQIVLSSTQASVNNTKSGVRGHGEAEVIDLPPP